MPEGIPFRNLEFNLMFCHYSVAKFERLFLRLEVRVDPVY